MADDRRATFRIYDIMAFSTHESVGYRCNQVMAEQADALIAFWDGKSRGTKHMIDIASEKGLPVRIVKT